MRVVLYARVSTEDQNCDLQLTELREYAARQKWEIVAEYVEKGVSGKLESRPQLNKLRQAAREGRFDAVLVWKLDRWGRSVIHSIESIQELVRNKVRFIATTQNIDTDQNNPMSNFILHIMAAFAELERGIIRERVVAGIAAAKVRGRKFGRPQKIFARDKVYALHAGGASIRQIAEQLEVGVGTVHRLLKPKAA
jgi:putative DNA-invertase from lambdoid prophage Rac